MLIAYLLRGLSSASSTASTTRRRHVQHPFNAAAMHRLEPLEGRTLLSADFGLAFALPAESSTGQAIAVDAQNNFYVAGTFAGTMDADPAADRQVLLTAVNGSGDGFVAKYDAAGGLVWARQMGGAGWDAAYGVAVDAGGNVFVTGSYEPAATFGDITLNGAGLYVAKLDATGNFLWADDLAGVSDSGYGFDLDVDIAGNVYTTGTVDVESFINTIVVVKHNADGQRQWAHKFGGGGGNGDGFGIAVDGTGNAFVTGHYSGQIDFDPGPGAHTLKSITYKAKGSTVTTLDAFVLSLDAAGKFRWAGSMGGTGDDQGLGIALDSAGSVHLTGQFGASLFTGKNAPTTTNDFDPGSGTLSLANAGSLDIFAVKLHDTGDLDWGRSIGGTGWDTGYDVTVDSDSNVYTTGSFGYDAGQSADLDPGVGVYRLDSAGSTDSFVSKLNAAGEFLWAAGMGGTEEDHGVRIAVDSAGSVYTTGVYHGQADFDPGVGAHLLSTVAYEEAYVSKLTQLVPPPAPASLSISDVTVTEGNTGTSVATFVVTRSGDSSEQVTVAYSTADDSAIAGVDYLAASGELTFAAGETSRFITVVVNGDRLGELNETFDVHLSGATNATIADGPGVGTILDDEPRISINDVQKKEGRSGTTLFTFTVILSTAYDEAITINYATVDGSATASDSDYRAASGSLTFLPGETSRTITIEVVGDRKREAHETFYLDLSGNSSNSLFNRNRGIASILNDD